MDAEPGVESSSLVGLADSQLRVSSLDGSEPHTRLLSVPQVVTGSDRQQTWSKKKESTFSVPAVTSVEHQVPPSLQGLTASRGDEASVFVTILSKNI